MTGAPASGGAPLAVSGADAARLHTQAANEPDQASMVTLLCKAAELAPDNGQYGKDCDIGKIALLGSDRQMLKNAQEASDAGKLETARRYAKYVSPLSPDVYRQAQALLLRLNTTNVARSPQKQE